MFRLPYSIMELIPIKSATDDLSQSDDLDFDWPQETLQVTMTPTNMASDGVVMANDTMPLHGDDNSPGDPPTLSHFSSDSRVSTPCSNSNPHPVSVAHHRNSIATSHHIAHDLQRSDSQTSGGPCHHGYPPPPRSLVDSRASLTSSSVVDLCRICHCESEPGAPLISPCMCSGSLKYVHQSCLQQWIKSADTKSCELCKFDFQMTTKIKPFRKWQKLEMNTVERRKIMCSVTFHIIAITCVIWSLYVLIDRTTEEIKAGILEWPFWTKLIVVAIGFTGGLVFMYVQCKMYVQLCRRWRAYNRVIFIQNCPERGHKVPTAIQEMGKLEMTQACQETELL